MPALRKKRPRKKAPAVIYFRSARNEKEHRQTCVYAECDMGGTVVGPFWGHTDSTIKKALATLTQECDCPAKFHSAQEYRGKRIHKHARRES